MDKQCMDVERDIAERLHELFVVNDRVVALQMPDGNYIPQRIPFNENLIYDMLIQKACIGTYQQQYYRNTVKWMCLDFDLSKDRVYPIGLELSQEEDFCYLVKELVIPVVNSLRALGITCLIEFSGRRGIHIWIHVQGVIEKSTAFLVVQKISTNVREIINENQRFGLDLFPATGVGNNKYGKLVKLPLSVHRKGGSSFFIRDICEESIEEWLRYPEKKDFWELQLQILSEYRVNDPEDLLNKLQISIEEIEKKKFCLYKKEYILSNQKISLDLLCENCKDCKVLYKLFSRTREGSINYLDRLILVGTFSHFNGGDMLMDFFKIQNNYKEEVSKREIERFKNKYYSVTMAFLYDLYGEELESWIHPETTILEYMSGKFGFELLPYEEKTINIPEDFYKLKRIRNKELRYMEYDDEVLSVSDYLKIKELKDYDFNQINNQIKAIISGKEIEIKPMKYAVYKRYEEGKEKPRKLISLNVKDRVLTTALIYEFMEELCWRFDSYSYNLNLWDEDFIFFPWYSSWQRFRKQVEVYLRADFFSEFGLLKLDLKNFYDSIYFHSIYSQMETILTKHAKNIEKVKYITNYLGRYTETLMKAENGNIKGIPQGPAYARVMAELYISTLLVEFRKKYSYGEDVCKVIRYVDDIYVVYRGIDGYEFMERIANYFFEHGLTLNRGKSCCYEKIGNMSIAEKEEIFGDSDWNYAIRSIQGIELDDEDALDEHMIEFDRYIHRTGDWNIKDANFILNGYIDKKYVDRYLDKFGEELIKQTIGRGSIFKRLYTEIFSRDDWRTRFFRKRLYCTIPKETVNFKNFLSVCYIQYKQLQLLKKDDQMYYIEWLQKLGDLTVEERGTARALIKLLY